MDKFLKPSLLNQTNHNNFHNNQINNFLEAVLLNSLHNPVSLLKINLVHHHLSTLNLRLKMYCIDDYSQNLDSMLHHLRSIRHLHSILWLQLHQLINFQLLLLHKHLHLHPFHNQLMLVLVGLDFQINHLHLQGLKDSNKWNLSLKPGQWHHKIRYK